MSLKRAKSMMRRLNAKKVYHFAWADPMRRGRGFPRLYCRKDTSKGWMVFGKSQVTCKRCKSMLKNGPTPLPRDE